MSLRLRLTLTYLLVTISGLLLLGGGFIALAERYTRGQREQTLAAQAEVYTSFVAELVRTPTELQSLAPSLTSGAVVPGEVTVRIFSPGGTLLSGTKGLGPFPSRPVREQVVSSLPVPISQVAQRRYVAYPIQRNGELLGIAELSHATDEEARLSHALRITLGQAALLAALVMTGVSLLVARSIAQPITQLTQYAGELAAGDPAHLLPSATSRSSRSSNEIQVLARSLEHMANQLQARISEAENQHTRLTAVLTTISEGVIALDAMDKILFANPAAAILLDVAGTDEITPRLADLKLPAASPIPTEHEVMVGRRQLLITISPVTPPAAGEPVLSTPSQVPATVWVLRDITRLNALEQARTRFFRSISHDLRTPLTAIRGMLENLQDSAPPEQHAPLATLEDETARLTRLVEELLHPPGDGLLLPSEQRPVDLATLVRDLCLLQQGRARRAGISLICEAPANLPPISGDRDRLKQAILNLLDNALRFTPAGGTVAVQISLAQTDPPTAAPVVRVCVTDSGPGVPPALREQIWERGVRGVDLGQTGAETGQRGAGLGLAIVREIATAHGGSAWLAEHAAAGAQFVLELPVRTRREPTEDQRNPAHQW